MKKTFVRRRPPFAFRGLISLFTFLALTGCLKEQSEKTFDLLTKNGNEWNVDKMVITTLHYSTFDVIDRQELFDVGVFTFGGKKLDDEDCSLKFDGEVLLTDIYNYYFGPFELPLYYSSTDLTTNYDVLGESTVFDIVYLDRKQLTLYVRASLNGWWVGGLDFCFAFECTKL